MSMACKLALIGLAECLNVVGLSAKKGSHFVSSIMFLNVLRSLANIISFFFYFCDVKKKKNNNQSILLNLSKVWKRILLYLQTQIRFPIGGESVSCHWPTDSLGRTKLTNSLGKQRLEGSMRTWSGRASSRRFLRSFFSYFWVWRYNKTLHIIVLFHNKVETQSSHWTWYNSGIEFISSLL